MKLLLDQGLPRSTVSFLRIAEVEALHVGVLGMAMADDAVIIEYAKQHGMIAVTLDADFHAILAHSGAISPSVIRIRIEGMRAEHLCTMLLNIIAQCETELSKGCAVSVHKDRIRIRLLPLR